MNQLKPYYSRTEFLVLKDLLQVPGSAPSISISPSFSRDPPAARRKQPDNTEERTAKRTQQHPQGSGPARMKKTKQGIVPLQQKPAPMGKRKRLMENKQRKRPTPELKPTTSEQATEIWQPRSTKRKPPERSTKRKTPDEARSIPFQETKKSKKRSKDSERRSGYYKAKRKPEFQSPQPTRKAGRFNARRTKRKDGLEVNTSRPRRLRIQEEWKDQECEPVEQRRRCLSQSICEKFVNVKFLVLV
ncbi:hypothetical protein X975_14035, partial [Stegodyphus mimosarum]